MTVFRGQMKFFLTLDGVWSNPFYERPDRVRNENLIKTNVRLIVDVQRGCQFIINLR